MKRYEKGVGLRLWPGGWDAQPQAPFSSHCDEPQPLVLFWEFPENYFHAMATFTALWRASEAGAIDLSRVSLALGLPFSPARGMPRWMTQPLQALLGGKGDVGPEYDVPQRIATLSTFAGAGRGEITSPTSQNSDGPVGADVVQPSASCHQSLPVCAVSSFLKKAPPGMYDFMQELKRRLMKRHLGVALAKDAAPDSSSGRAPFVTAPDGVLRVTLAVRDDDGSRRLLNTAELLADCNKAGSLDLPASAPAGTSKLAVRCEAYAFGSGPDGLASDAAKMHDTDVLVAVHGAGLTNLGFLRPGASVVELRPSKFRAENGNRFYRPMARDSRVLKWWGVVMYRTYEPKGRLELAGQGDPDQYGRDHDVILPWRGLAEALGKVLPLSWAAWADSETSGKIFTEISPGERGFR